MKTKLDHLTNEIPDKNIYAAINKWINNIITYHDNSNQREGEKSTLKKIYLYYIFKTRVKLSNLKITIIFLNIWI